MNQLTNSSQPNSPHLPPTGFDPASGVYIMDCISRFRDGVREWRIANRIHHRPGSILSIQFQWNRVRAALCGNQGLCSAADDFRLLCQYRASWATRFHYWDWDVWSSDSVDYGNDLGGWWENTAVGSAELDAWRCSQGCCCWCGVVYWVDYEAETVGRVE